MHLCHPSTSFVIVLCWDEIERMIDLKEKVQSCFEQTQRFELLLFTKNKRPKNDLTMPSRISIVTPADFNLLGRITTKKTTPVLNEQFDVGIILSELTGRQERVVRSMNIHHTVGFNYDSSFIDINLISHAPQTTHKLLLAKNTLSKITTR